MLTEKDVQEMVNAGGKHFLVTNDGHVIRAVEVTGVGQFRDAPAVQGYIPDPTQTGSTAGTVKASLPLDDCIYWSTDPGDAELREFVLSFHGPDRLVMVSWRYGLTGRAFGATVAEAIAALGQGRNVNPPACCCDFAHCSFPGCSSVIPSFGAVPEESRSFPVSGLLST